MNSFLHLLMYFTDALTISEQLLLAVSNEIMLRRMCIMMEPQHNYYITLATFNNVRCITYSTAVMLLQHIARIISVLMVFNWNLDFSEASANYYTEWSWTLEKFRTNFHSFFAAYEKNSHRFIYFTFKNNPKISIFFPLERKKRFGKCLRIKLTSSQTEAKRKN